MISLLSILIIGFLVYLLIIRKVAKLHNNIEVIFNSEYNKRHPETQL